MAQISNLIRLRPTINRRPVRDDSGRLSDQGAEMNAATLSKTEKFEFAGMALVFNGLTAVCTVGVIFFSHWWLT